MRNNKKNNSVLQLENNVFENELLLSIKKILGKKYNTKSPFRSEKQKELLCKFVNQSSDTIVGIMPTNSGKSLIYQAGALYLGATRKEKTIVISPLISLMLDQIVIDSLYGEEKNLFAMKNRFGFLVFNSTVRNLYPRYYKQAQEAFRSGHYNLIYVSPERFRSKPFLDVYKKQKIARFVIDEMHCVSIWGKSFRYEYKNLASVIRYHDPRLILLTASANKKMIKETVEQLKGKGAYKRVDIVEKNIYREEIIINKPIKVANEEQRPRVVLKLIKNRIKEGGKILVFTSFARENEKRKDAESLTKFYRNNAARIGLKKNQIACYHAQMDPEERSIAQEKFKNGRVKLLVATKAFGMGVDIKNINAVIHIYPPVTIEEYYQEIGRGGRNATKQEPAIAQLIWSDDDEENLRPFINGRWDFRYMQIYYLLSQGYIVICEEDDNQSLAISKYMAEWYKNKWISKPRKRKIGRYHILGTRVRDRRSARKICEFISDKRNESKRKAPKDVKRVARWLYSYLSIKNDSFIIPPPVYIPRSLRAPVNHYKEVLSVMEESGWVIRSETDTNENGSIYSKYKILLDDLPADIIKDFGEMISLESERKYDSWTLMQKVCQSKDPWRIIMKNLYGKDK